MSLDARYIDEELMRLHSIHLGIIDCSEDTYGRVLSRKAKKILKQSGMIDKTCAMVRDDGGNLRTSTIDSVPEFLHWELCLHLSP